MIGYVQELAGLRILLLANFPFTRKKVKARKDATRANV
jgi:hypothetical protein